MNTLATLSTAQRETYQRQMQAAFPYQAWAVANYAARMAQQNLLRVDWQRVGGILHLGAGERFERIEPPQTEPCEYCGQIATRLHNSGDYRVCVGCGHTRRS